MSVKICIIGAGSASFSINLVKDVCINPLFKDATISLMDINEERLNSVYGMCKRFCEELGSKLNIIKTQDRREAMKGADFVLNVCLNGGQERFKQCIEVGYKNGYRFGGSLHVLHDEGFYINFHQFQLMESILVDMLDICPKAYFILVANPVQAGVTYLQRKYPMAKIVGMCHGFNGAYKVAEVMGMEHDDVHFEIAGVNHFIWMTSFRYKGQDAYPMLDKWLEEHNGVLASDEQLEKLAFHGDEVSKKAVDLYKRYGLFPIGDTPSAGGGAWGWEYHTDDATEAQYQCTPYDWYQKLFVANENRMLKLKEQVADTSKKMSEMFSIKSSPEPMIPLIEGLAFDTDTRVIVNVLNDGGYVEGIPTDYEVEVAARVDLQGVHPIHSKGLPKPLLAHLMRDRIAPVEIELDAYQNHSRDGLIDLILMDPWTKSRAQAEKLLDDILNLPLNADMKEYYK